MLRDWLAEDLGRGDRATQALLSFGSASDSVGSDWVTGVFRLKQPGVVAGLPLAARVFALLDDQVVFSPRVQEGETCEAQTVIAEIQGSMAAILMGERVALNLLMRLSGVATLTHCYVLRLAGFSTQLADTRKTTPGLRVLEKYATRLGGGCNHRFGLDDAVMLKDNHIVAAGGIGAAIACARQSMPFPLALEVETETLAQVQECLEYPVDIIMLDNMPLDILKAAVKLIRERRPTTKIEASGNITLDTLGSVAETGVDYISTSAPITQAPWLDISLRLT